MGLPGLRLLERKFEGPIRLFELKKCALEKQIERQLREFEHKRNVGLDDDLRFIRSWLEKPLAIGAVKPSGKVLARTMAQYVDPDSDGPVIELGPGTGPVTQALVEQGVDPSRLVLVEFNAAFCRLLRARYPQATVVQGDAYGLRRVLDNFLYQPAAAIVSGLPLMTKPARIRLRLIADALNSARAGRTVRPIHLCGGLSAPQAAARRTVGGVRAHLAQHAASAGLGLQEAGTRYRESGNRNCLTRDT